MLAEPGVKKSEGLPIGEAPPLMGYTANGILAHPPFQRFLVSVPVGAAATNSITIELNWNSALKR